MKLPPNETTLVTILRGLLIAEIVITVLAIPLLLFSGAIVESVLQDAGFNSEASDAEMVVVAFSCMFFVVIVPALIVSWIGLFNFWNWARWLYLGANVVGSLLAIPISVFDFSFQWGLPTAILDLAAPISGAIVAIVFLSPVAHRFQQVQPSFVDPPPAREL